MFASEEKAAKASVVLKLKRSTVDPEQADAIRSLVAGAVENLSADQVTLVDADGRVNLKPRSKNAAEEEAEQAMEAKLVAMLEPLAGRDNVRATVNVSYDEGSEERTDEVYDPSQAATLSMQKSEQVSALPAQSYGGSGDGEQLAGGRAGGCGGGIAGGGCSGNSAAVAEGGAAGVSAAGQRAGPEYSGRERNLWRDEASAAFGRRAGAGAARVRRRWW